MERLAALVPPPRFNLTRYSGVLAPGSTYRSLVVPQVEVQALPPHAGCQGGIATTKTESGKANEKSGGRPRNYPWAQLMTRVFDQFEVLTCPRCGARMRILAAINPPDAIRKILACLGLPARNPPIGPAILDTDAPDFCRAEQPICSAIRVRCAHNPYPTARFRCKMQSQYGEGPEVDISPLSAAGGRGS